MDISGEQEKPTGVSGAVLRTLGDVATDRVALEYFSNSRLDFPIGDNARIANALAWSAGIGGGPVYADHRYTLTQTIDFPAHAALICSPGARFIRAPSFGNPGPGAGKPMVKTVGTDAPGILIDGGIWGPEKPDRYTETVTFVSGTPNGTIIFVDAANFGSGDYLQVIASGNPNDEKIFTVVSPNPGSLTVSPSPSNSSASMVTISKLPPGGVAFDITSSDGIVRNVELTRSRGIQFNANGDRLLIHNCRSRDTADDGGGGLRVNGGDGFRAYAMDLQTNDDCYQFNPSPPGAAIRNASIFDSVGSTNQGSLCAFILGGDNLPPPSPGGGSTDADQGSIQSCLFANIRGDIGGDPYNGGYAIKFNCVNALNTIENCWAEDIAAKQDDLHGNNKASVHVIVGLGPQTSPPFPGSGVVGCGVRNVTVENRTGPALLIDRYADSRSTSTNIDFTVDGLTSKGPGSVKGAALVEVHLGRRVVLRDVTGDLSNGGGSVDPGVALDIATGLNDRLDELVVDGVAATNATLAANKGGLWRFGNVGSSRVRRLTVTPADPTNGSGMGGLQLFSGASAAVSPQWAVFDGVNFDGLSTAANPGQPIVSWFEGSGNAIINPIGFDPDPFAIAVSSGPLKTISPPSYASLISVTVAAASPATATVNNMAPPPAKTSPERTLLLGERLSVKTTSPTNFITNGYLTGPNHSITFRWVAGLSKWQEVARS